MGDLFPLVGPTAAALGLRERTTVRYWPSGRRFCSGLARTSPCEARVGLLRSRQRGLTARRAEARGIVTRMGRDRASGVGSAQPTRARSQRDTPSPRSGIDGMACRMVGIPDGASDRQSVSPDFRDRSRVGSSAVKAGCGRVARLFEEAATKFGDAVASAALPASCGPSV